MPIDDVVGCNGWNELSAVFILRGIFGVSDEVCGGERGAKLAVVVADAVRLRLLGGNSRCCDDVKDMEFDRGDDGRDIDCEGDNIGLLVDDDGGAAGVY
jgi:hypothetical protein